MCHRLSRDQPQPGSLFQRPREAEKRDPGNEVARDFGFSFHVLFISEVALDSFAVEF